MRALDRAGYCKHDLVTCSVFRGSAEASPGKEMRVAGKRQDLTPSVPLDPKCATQAGGLGQAFHLADHHGVGDLECHVGILVMLIKTSSIYIDDLDEAKHEMNCVSSVDGQEAKSKTCPRGGGGLDPVAGLGRVAARY